MRELCDHLLTIPTEQTPQIQEGTMLVLHTICELVEQQPVRRMSGRAAFLDRDGTINEKAPEGDYVTTPEQWRFLRRCGTGGAAAGRRRLAGGGGRPTSAGWRWGG